jgi:hypothetical protein
MGRFHIGFKLPSSALSSSIISLLSWVKCNAEERPRWSWNKTNETLASCFPINHLLTDPYKLTPSQVLKSLIVNCQHVTLSGNRQLTGLTYSAHRGGRLANAPVLMACLDRPIFGLAASALLNCVWPPLEGTSYSGLRVSLCWGWLWGGNKFNGRVVPMKSRCSFGGSSHKPANFRYANLLSPSCIIHRVCTYAYHR